MSLPFVFNPPTGINDTTQFPDDDPQIRVHLQALLDQLKTCVNTDIQNQLNLIPYNSTYRQAIINGNFDIWQRGTSFTGAGYTADRWLTSYDGTITKTYSQQAFTPGQTLVPNNPKNFFRCQVSSASGQTWHTIGQRIEDVNTFSNMQVSVSFYAKADTARTLNANFKQEFGTGGNTSVTIGTDTQFNLTTDWQKFNTTFTIPSISGKTVGANSDLLFYFGIPINTASTIDIAQVQINAGSIVLPFIPKSYAQELNDCQRYYQTGVFKFKAITSTRLTTLSSVLQTAMRIAGWNISRYGSDISTPGNTFFYDNDLDVVTSSVIISSKSSGECFFDGLNSSNSIFTPGHVYTVGMHFDAEL